jgi:hypothetical protein
MPPCRRCYRHRPTGLQEEAYDIREDHVRTELSQRFRTNFEQAGVGLDMKASGKPPPLLLLLLLLLLPLMPLTPLTMLCGRRQLCVAASCNPARASDVAPACACWCGAHGRILAILTLSLLRCSLPAGAMHPLGSEVVKACLPDGQRKAFRHNMMALMTITGAKGSVVNFSQVGGWAGLMRSCWGRRHVCVGAWCQGD